MIIGFFSRVLFGIGGRRNLTIVWGLCNCVQHNERSKGVVYKSLKVMTTYERGNEGRHGEERV